MADLLDDVKGFLGSLGEDLTRLHVAACRVAADSADHEALTALVDVPGALIGQAQGLLARVDGAREPKDAAKPAPAAKPAEASKRRKAARK